MEKGTGVLADVDGEKTRQCTVNSKTINAVFLNHIFYPGLEATDDGRVFGFDVRKGDVLVTEPAHLFAGCV